MGPLRIEIAGGLNRQAVIRTLRSLGILGRTDRGNSGDTIRNY